MSQIQQLLTAVNNLTERLSQIESNSKRIFELPQNITPNGLSKFAISRPEGIGETTEYMTLNKILEWCIEEMQNIENSTILVQMLPPELLSSPRRIKIPTLSGEAEVPIVWKILGVQYSESVEQVFEIPDADEGNYRKDLILGTQNGDIIRFQGVESDEGVIEPIQPENTVLLTSMVVFGDSVYQEPTEPIVGDMYVKKAGFTSFMFTGSSRSQVFKDITETSKNLFIHPLSLGQGSFSGYLRSSDSNVYDGMFLQVENRRATSVMMRNKSTSTPPPGSQFTYIKFDFRNDELENYELKPGEVLTFVLIGDFAVLVCSNMAIGDFIPLSGTEEGKPVTGTVEIKHEELFGFELAKLSGFQLEFIKEGVGATTFSRGGMSFYNGAFEAKFVAFSETGDGIVVADEIDGKGLVGANEFDKQGDRKAFAQISDLEDSIETAGFLQRTGTAIAFDKWATYGTYAAPVSGNLSYSFADMVKGMIQVMYHEDMNVPAVLQAGVTVIQSGDYVVDNVNKITVHCIDEDVIEVNIKAL